MAGSWSSRFKMDNDLILVNVLGILLISAIALFPESFVRTVIGLPFVLFFPGYALICALFPKKKDLDEIERVALSIGLSIAVVPLIGLVLNYTPFGIRLYPVLVSLFFFTFLMSLATAYRRKGVSVRDRFAPSFSVPRLGKLSKTDKVLSVGFIAGIVVFGGLMANFANTPGEQFSEFYVLGLGGKVEGYPTNLTVGEEGKVVLGVIGEIGEIMLKHEEKWEQNYTFVPQEVGEKMKLWFLLFREGVDEPYRSLHLWISVKPFE